MFNVTCLKKNGSVGRDFIIIIIISFSTQTTEMHKLAVIMLHQHKFCVYKRKIKIKLLITSENFVLFAAFAVFILFCKYFLENVEKKFTVGGF